MQTNNIVSDYSLRHKKYFTIFLIIIVLIFISYLFLNYLSPIFHTSQSSKLSSDQVIPISQIEGKDIPENIPKGLITEKGIETVQSYTAVLGNKQQSTYQYLSLNSSKENIKLFEDYLIKNKWATYGKQDLINGFNYAYIIQDGSILTISSVPSGSDSTRYLITITIINKINN